MNLQILLLFQEEYPNPCETVCYTGKLHIFMDLGEVVKTFIWIINHPVSADKKCHMGKL